MTGSPAMDERLLDEAISWQRQLVGDDADWDGFTAWLEADPQHRRAFDEIALVDRIMDERRDDLRAVLPAAAEEDAERAPRRRRLLIGSIAAMLALAIGVPALWPGPSDAVYATKSGETRRIALAGGTAIDLAPSSKLIVDGSDGTSLRLDHGEALFAVRHDPQRQLSIRAGGYAISDIGTRFAVSLGEGTIRIGVAEGHVTVADHGGATTDLAAGEQLIAMAGAAMRKSVVAVEDIGSWRLGRLVYRDAPLSIVVADIARYSGQDISLEPSLRQRRFSGVLAIGDGSNLLANLAGLMALKWTRQGDRLRIGAAPAR